MQVEFELSSLGDVSLQLYDARGRRVLVRPTERFQAGASTVSWELPRLAAGVYFLKLAASGQESVATRLVIVD